MRSGEVQTPTREDKKPTRPRDGSGGLWMKREPLRQEEVAIAKEDVSAMEKRNERWQSILGLLGHVR